MEVDLAIKNGFLVIPEYGILKAALAVSGEKIIGIIENPQHLKAKEEIDAEGLYVLPGLVQPHAHLGQKEDMEDFATETRSASVGGVTTTLVFHRSTGAYGTEFSKIIHKAASLSHTDFSYHLQIMSDEHIENIPRYLQEFGISSFKLNMGYKGEEAQDKGIFELTDGLMYEAFKKIGALKGTIACVHAENSEIIAYNTARMKTLKRDDLIAWSESRPAYAETEAIQRALYFGELTHCPLYIAHMTTGEGLRLIRERRRKVDEPVFIETCPQYLTHHMHSALGRIGKFIPPLRTEADIEILWEGLKNGDIDTIGVDQGTRKVAPESVSFWERKTTPREAATTLPMLITEGFHKRGLTIEKIAALTSYNPARIFNLYPRKGTLQVGSDADVAIIDINREKKVTKDSVKSSSDFSLYEGWSLKGWPVATICRGMVVMRDGEPTGRRGWGRYIERKA